MNGNSERSKCTRCKVNLPKEHFLKKRNGDLYKRCIQCNEKSRLAKTCQHGKRRERCNECGGGEICEHEKRKYRCRECQGSSMCMHGRIKYNCKDCGGSANCQHGKRKTRCKECGGGQICKHEKIRSRCKDCNGSEICEHDTRKVRCKICDPTGHLVQAVRDRVSKALKSNKSKHSIEYLGIDIQTFKEHIQAQFKEGMAWENHGEVWHIDHITPLQYQNPTLEEVIERLHYTNCQPLWAEDNISKGNRFIG